MCLPALQLDNVAATVLGLGYALVAIIIFVTQSGELHATKR